MPMILLCETTLRYVHLQLSTLTQLVANGIANGEVKPLPITIFPRNKMEEAFRYLAAGKIS